MAMNDPVSHAERQLIAIACQLDTALRYRDEHGADDDWICQGIDDEMIGINEIFEAAGNTVPRLHALLRMIGERSERAQDLKETLNLDDFSINEIKKFCAFARKENPQWHPLLTMSNVRDLVSQLPPAVEWWLPGEPTMEDEEAAEDAAAEANAGEEDGDGDNDDEIQITESPDTAGSVQPRRSGRNTKGKAPALADDDSGTVDTSDGGDDIEMCEIVDNQKTPKKFQPVKRAICHGHILFSLFLRIFMHLFEEDIKGQSTDTSFTQQVGPLRPEWNQLVLLVLHSDCVLHKDHKFYSLHCDSRQSHRYTIVISPASEVPAKRQQRRTSAAAKAAAKAIGHLPNLSHGVSECLPQTDAPKAHVCQMCKIRKVPCNPPPKWAIPQIEAKQQAAKVKQDNKNHKCSAATIMEDLPPTLDGLKTRLDSMETNFTAFQEAMDVRMGALQDVLHNIDLMMHALCMRYKITPSTLALRIPPVPLFEQGAPPPSLTPGPSSIASTISSMSSAGFDVSQLSITAPPSSVASGSGTRQIHTPAPLSRTPSRGRGGAAIKPPSRAPSAAGSRASSRTRD
ncbi:hypothetical protein EDB86DRAFT_2831333 [Lactarius hatsudake]|nr:hypothetical protein EDB86DRAFT_2831333 [Lactarius hatsudake]